MTTTDFRFDLGRLSLNFVATVGARCSPQPVERLRNQDDLARWIRASGIVREQDPTPLIDAAMFATAIALREVLYRLVHDVVHHRQPQTGDLEFLNRTVQRAHPPVPQLVVAGSHWDMKLTSTMVLPQILTLVARDAINVLTGPDRMKLRECKGQRCDGIYVDRSRGFRRQWCSSKTCGNQIRAERFRHKERDND